MASPRALDAHSLLCTAVLWCPSFTGCAPKCATGMRSMRLTLQLTLQLLGSATRTLPGSANWLTEVSWEVDGQCWLG